MDIEKLIDLINEELDKSQAQKNANLPNDIIRLVEKSILLQELDSLWKDHIATLDYMRHTIVLRAYGQKDPLNEYKKEAFNMFSEMLNQLSEKVAFIILRTVIQQNSADKLEQKQSAIKEVHETPVNLLSGQKENSQTSNKPTTFSYSNQEFDINNPSTWGKVARNDLCPCGSGKKYKHCHGQM